MKTIFAILLTTFFLGAMPPEAAVARDTSLTNFLTFVDNLTPVPSGCVTIDGSLTPDVLETIDSRGGQVVLYKDADAFAFQTAVETALGQKAPFSASEVAVVIPARNADVVNIGFFEDSCLKAFIQLPLEFYTDYVKQFEKGKI